VLDSPPPKKHVGEMMAAETRFQITQHADPAHYDELVSRVEGRVKQRLALYEQLAQGAPK